MLRNYRIEKRSLVRSNANPVCRADTATKSRNPRALRENVTFQVAALAVVWLNLQPGLEEGGGDAVAALEQYRSAPIDSGMFEAFSFPLRPCARSRHPRLARTLALPTSLYRPLSGARSPVGDQR